MYKSKNVEHCYGDAAFAIPSVHPLVLTLICFTLFRHILCHTAVTPQVLSGLLVAPGVPEWAERREMETLADTYGKTVR